MTHKFLPPENVNYSLPFRLVGGNERGHIFEHTYNAEDEIVLTNLTTGESHKWYNFGDAVKANIEKGHWKVIDEGTQNSFAKSFQFDTKYGTTICTYTSQPSGNPVISWGTNSTDRYSEEDCRGKFESGEWTVLPSANTAEQSSENAFKALEDIMRSHKQLNMENGSTIVFATGGERPWKSASDNILDSIKAFSQTTSSVVLVTKGSYEVYWQNETFYAKTDKQLVQVMKALEVLEGCLGD